MFTRLAETLAITLRQQFRRFDNYHINYNTCVCDMVWWVSPGIQDVAHGFHAEN